MDADSVKRLIEDHEILRDQVIKLEMQIEELVSQAKIDQVIIAERFEMNQGLETLYNLSEALFEEIENQWGTEALDACSISRSMSSGTKRISDRYNLLLKPARILNYYPLATIIFSIISKAQRTRRNI